MQKFKRVYIEISNICNLQCDFCPEVDRPKKIMEPSAFAKHVNQIADFAEEICLHLMGEPLTHPQFQEIVEACERAQVPVNLTTNGTLLNKKNNADLLINPVFRQVNFSLQSYFGNAKSQTLGDYLRPIFHWTHLAFLRRPDLYINFRLWNSGTSEEEDQKLQILEAIEREYHVAVNPNVDVGFKKSKRVLNKLYLHFDSRFIWPSESFGLPEVKPSTTGTCHGLRSHIGVHADGTVVPCCLDKEAQLPLGNLNLTSLAEILDSPRALSMREGFELNELRESLCQKCTYVRRFNKT